MAWLACYFGFSIISCLTFIHWACRPVLHWPELLVHHDLISKPLSLTPAHLGWGQGFRQNNSLVTEKVLWMFVSPQNLYVEALPFNVMVFGDGTFGGLMRSWGWGPHDGISALVRKDTRELALSLPTHAQRSLVSTQQDGGHLQTRRRILRMKPTLAAPWSWTSKMPE